MKLRLSGLPGNYAICRLDPHDDLPVVREARFFSVTRTGGGISIVCEERFAPANAPRVERGWRCLELHGPFPFSAVGVMASLTKPLADASISVFAISTYDTDYLLVKSDKLEEAAAALRSAGHEVNT
jgi:hypothetical protein